MTDFVLAPKQAIAVIVMIAFIMVCVFAPFGAAHAIVGLSTAAVTILIAGLAAIGITFASTGGFDTLEDYVSSLLQDYASNQNIPVTSIFNGTQYGANAAGKLILNNRFVQLISGFANWLKVKYSLVDNSTYQIQSAGIFFGSYELYQCPLEMTGPYGHVFLYVEQADPEEVYVAAVTSGSQKYMLFFSTNKNAVIYKTTYNPQGQITNQTSFKPDYRAAGLYWYRSDTNTGIDNAGFTFYPQSDVISTLTAGGSIDENNIGIDINTSIIDIPTDRTGYTDSDGAVLDVSAPWSEPVSGVINTVPSSWDMVEDDTLVYTLDLEAEAVLEEQLPHPTDIENLPGATIPGLPDIEDGEPWHLEFSNLWHYVAQWISDMSAGGAVIWNTCIQAPPAIINFVFAGIVLAMWFGAIKILR